MAEEQHDRERSVMGLTIQDGGDVGPRRGEDGRNPLGQLVKTARELSHSSIALARCAGRGRGVSRRSRRPGRFSEATASSQIAPGRGHNRAAVTEQ